MPPTTFKMSADGVLIGGYDANGGVGLVMVANRHLFSFADMLRTWLVDRHITEPSWLIASEIKGRLWCGPSGSVWSAKLSQDDAEALLGVIAPRLAEREAAAAAARAQAYKDARRTLAETLARPRQV